MFYRHSCFIFLFLGQMNVKMPKVPEGSPPPVFNPYPLLGGPESPAIWPRGFPLCLAKDGSTWNLTLEDKTVDGEKVAVLQSLADHEPGWRRNYCF